MFAPSEKHTDVHTHTHTHYTYIHICNIFIRKGKEYQNLSTIKDI